MTHAAIKEKKAKPIIYKENNPARQFMSHADALADNARIREERLAVEKYKAELKAKRNPLTEPLPEGTEEVSGIVEPTATEKKIAKLEDQLANERGPGSNHRKARLQKEIDKLKGVEQDGES